VVQQWGSERLAGLGELESRLYPKQRGSGRCWVTELPANGRVPGRGGNERGVSEEMAA